jgi:hypothetical protein
MLEDPFRMYLIVPVFKDNLATLANGSFREHSGGSTTFDADRCNPFSSTDKPFSDNYIPGYDIPETREIG